MAAASDISLLQHLELPQLNCLNESENQTLKSIISNRVRNTDASQHLLSDVDEQLLLNISFNQAVRIRSIIIQSSSVDQGPKSLTLLINRPSLGFEDVQDSEGAQTLELSEEEVLQGKRIQLKYVKFQSVNSLHIFVESNQGDEDQTRIDAIDIFGVPVEATKDLSGLRQNNE